MVQRKRTKAHIRAEREYRKKRKRIILDWHLEKDAELLNWLRSQVSDDSELPALIKEIVIATRMRSPTPSSPPSDKPQHQP